MPAQLSLIRTAGRHSGMFPRMGPQESVLQKRPLIIEPGGLEGEGFESGPPKIGIEGGAL